MSRRVLEGGYSIAIIPGGEPTLLGQAGIRGQLQLAGLLDFKVRQARLGEPGLRCILTLNQRVEIVFRHREHRFSQLPPLAASSDLRRVS